MDTVAELLLATAAAHGSAEALVDGEVRFDHAAFVERAGVVAARLVAAGVTPGDRVGVLLPNGWQYAVSYLGAQLAGAVVVLVNSRFTAPEVEYVLSDSAASLVVSDPSLGSLVQGVAVLDADGLTAAATLADRQLAGWPGLARRSTDVAHLLYTSGTTGRPKGAMQTHANLVFNAGTVRRALGAGPGERTLVAAPMFHATGMVSQLIGFLGAGGCCVFTPAFRADTTLRLLVEERITVFAGVAAMLRLLLLQADADSADLSALRLFVMGGSPVPEPFPAEVARRLPHLTLANVWGLTEATSIVTYVEAEEYRARPWSVGRSVAGVRVAVSVDGTSPRDAPGVVGELCVSGPVVVAGYWGNPDATAHTFVDGWLHTGDIGSVDADGYVRVLDRAKDMIIRGGENVYSLEVENVLAAHADVAEVAVVGVPDPMFDERVRAVVVLRPGATAGAADLQAYAGLSLARYKVPAEVVFVTELPRNPAGKVRKRELAALSAPVTAST